MAFDFHILPLLMFSSSLIGILVNRDNIILILISIEIMLFSLSINFAVIFYSFWNYKSLMIILCIITVAAVESAIGLSIMILFYKIRGSLSLRFLNLLKG